MKNKNIHLAQCAYTLVKNKLNNSFPKMEIEPKVMTTKMTTFTNLFPKKERNIPSTMRPAPQR